MELKDTPGVRKNSAAVRKAREKLAAEADTIIEEFRAMIRMAAAQGEYEAALKAQQWLVDHIPNEDGQRVIDGTTDKVQVEAGPKGPLIQIGIIQGGISKKELPAVPDIIVEAETLD